MVIQELGKEEVKVVSGGLVAHKSHLHKVTPHHLAAKSASIGHTHLELKKLDFHHHKKLGS